MNSILKESSIEELDWDTIVSIYNSASKNGLNLVKEVLDMSALGNGKIELELKAGLLGPLIENTIKPFQAMLSKRHLSISVSQEIEAEVMMDSNRMSQVISNLIHNVYKYAKAESTLMIHLAENEGMAVVTFENDTGESTFEPEVDEDSLGSTRYGFEIVSEILKLHNSQLDIVQEEGRFKASFKLPLLS